MKRLLWGTPPPTPPPSPFATKNVQGDYSCGCGCGLRITTWFPGTATDLLSVHLICPCFGSQLTSQKDSFFNATTMKMLSLMFVRGLESLVNGVVQGPREAEIIYVLCKSSLSPQNIRALPHQWTRLAAYRLSEAIMELWIRSIYLPVCVGISLKHCSQASAPEIYYELKEVPNSLPLLLEKECTTGTAI